jgi:hypothetical protein
MILLARLLLLLLVDLVLTVQDLLHELSRVCRLHVIARGELLLNRRRKRRLDRFVGRRMARVKALSKSSISRDGSFVGSVFAVRDGQLHHLVCVPNNA